MLQDGVKAWAGEIMKKQITIAGLTLATVLMLNACVGGTQATQTPATTSSQVLTTATASSAGPSPTVSLPNESAFQIKAGQTPEAMARDYLAIITAWINAACYPDTAADYLKHSNLAIEAYTEGVAAQQAPRYAVGLYGADYASNPDAKTYVANMTALNAKVLQMYLISDPSHNPTIKAHYKQTNVFDSLTSASKNGTRSTVVFEGHMNNNSQDSPGTLTLEPSDQKRTYTLTFEENNGVERVVSEQVVNH
jgi:hypothetical protein